MPKTHLPDGVRFLTGVRQIDAFPELQPYLNPPRLSHALKNLSKISEKFRLGEVSYSKVRAMTRVATGRNEDFQEQKDVSAETCSP